MNEHVARVLLELQSQFDVWLHKQVFDNEFLIAGIGTLMLGAAGYLLRSVPAKLWRGYLRASTVELVINNDSEAFRHAMRYLNRHRIGWLQRTFMVGSNRDQERYRGDWVVGPGYGASVFIFERRLVIGTVTKEESDSWTFKLALTLRFVGRSQERVKRFMAAVQAEALRGHRTGIDVFGNAINRWSLVAENKPCRALDTVFIPKADKETLLERLNWFYANEAWFRRRGLTYKLGILLTGVPGTGKSSLIHAIASHFDKNIRLLNLNVMSDSSVDMIGSLSRRDLLVIEDIDTFSVAAARKQRRPKIPELDGPPAMPEDDRDDLLGVSLSTVLNMLDGLLSPDGVVTIATTNHPENLDPALIRKGRFDLQIDIGALDPECMVEMFAAFYGENWRAAAKRFVASGLYEPVVGAEAQDLFRHEKPETALARLTARERSAA